MIRSSRSAASRWRGLLRPRTSVVYGSLRSSDGALCADLACFRTLGGSNGALENTSFAARAVATETSSAHPKETSSSSASASDSASASASPASPASTTAHNNSIIDKNNTNSSDLSSGISSPQFTSNEVHITSSATADVTNGNLNASPAKSYPDLSDFAPDMSLRRARLPGGIEAKGAMLEVLHPGSPSPMQAVRREDDTIARLRGPYLQELVKLQQRVERERRVEGAMITRSSLLTTRSSSIAEASEEPLKDRPSPGKIYIDPMTKLATYGKNQEEAEAFSTNITEHSLKSMNEHFLAWFKSLSDEITREQERMRSGVSSVKTNFRNRSLAMLMLLPADLLAILAIQEMMHFVNAQPQGATFVNLTMRMGRAVMNEINVIKGSGEVDSWAELQQRVDHDEGKLDVLNEYMYSMVRQPSWDTATTAQVGAVLIDMLCRCAFLQMTTDSRMRSDGTMSSVNRIPAFYHTSAVQAAKSVGVVVAHHAILAKLLQSQDINDFLSVNQPLTRPMACPPRPWTTPFDGGFLTQRFPLLRVVRGGKEQLKLLRMADSKSCEGLYAGLNALGNVAWTVNKPLFEVAKKVLEMDITFTGRPSVQDDRYVEMEHAIQSAELEYNLQVKQQQTVSDRRTIFARLQKLKRTKQEYMSKNMDYKSKLSLAQFVSDFEQFWFPYSLDFRGRAYPIPPVSHMGDDLARSLLVFKDRRPLGKRGMYWLKVHLANQMGQDKASFDERVAWVDEHLDELLDSAAEPFDPVDPKHTPKMWATAENCWQALATCMELKRAVDSGNPEEYLSNMPVHQDGSCNGLQHYAALGRDRKGGEEVNLVARSRPGDVYTTVAKTVRKNIMEMSKADDAQGKICKKLNGQISRKVVKQTVMTSVYGVTYIGARDQILRQLETVNDRNKEMRFNGDEGYGEIFETDDELNEAAGLLAKVVLDAIGDTFQSARDVKEWFKKLGKVATDAGDPISWITPLGLPVVQPYRVKHKSQIRTVMQQVVVSEYHEDAKINSRKQQTAFPPNFVHSIDSTHMLMTARSCAEKGISFTAVHDSYWTHPGDVEAMNVQLREEFVKLHSQELLEDLYQQFLLRYPQRAHLIPPPPKGGDLDISEVMNSKYFFN